MIRSDRILNEYIQEEVYNEHIRKNDKENKLIWFERFFEKRHNYEIVSIKQVK